MSWKMQKMHIQSVKEDRIFSSTPISRKRVIHVFSVRL
jgi:hypothetical protein